MEMVGAGRSFDPGDQAGFHLKMVRRVMAELRANDGGRNAARASEIGNQSSFHCLGEEGG